MPGLEKSILSFEKAENTYSGHIQSEKIDYKFQKSDLSELIALIGFSIGIKEYKTDHFKSISIKELSKSIDALLEFNSKDLILPANLINRELKILKSQVNSQCSICNKTQFDNDKLVGCNCFIELSKNEHQIIKYDSYIILKFGKNWLEDEINELSSRIKRKK